MLTCCSPAAVADLRDASLGLTAGLEGTEGLALPALDTVLADLLTAGAAAAESAADDECENGKASRSRSSYLAGASRGRCARAPHSGLRHTQNTQE